MSRFRDSSRFADRLRDMSGDELLQEMKQRFGGDGDKFFEPRSSRRDYFERPFPHFPRGFSFDDDTDIFDRSRRDGIRSHLDDLAARHPELAEHLRGPPWSFGSSLLRDRRRQRRGSGGSNSDGQQQQGQHQVDEDARSQASGSSAASGASAVSSRSGDEPDLTSSSAIPQYGLRNTVDIGQQQRRRGMEMSPETGDRGQRSMSAPPENRQQQGQSEQQQQSQPGQGQRFVSRVDITPQHNQQQPNNQQRSQSPSKSASNVRHIPIFVEGRDEPVLPKFKADKAPSPPPAFHQRQSSPPSFHRPSHFNDHFSRQQWPPGFYDPPAFDPGFESSFRPMRRQFQQQPQYHKEPHYQQQQPQYRQQQQQQPPPPPPPQQPQHRQQQQQQHPQQKQQQQQEQEQEPPKPKQTIPKDPLEKVADIQKEVDDLAEQVRRYAGGSRQDKEYVYLDEMLTRELIKLDDIETEGRENVRQARRNAIRTIQETISLLETKAPLAGQQEQQLEKMQEENEQSEEQCVEMKEESQASVEPIDAKQENQNNEPLPLGSSLETKEKESLENKATTTESMNQNAAAQQQTNMDVEREVEKTAEMKEPVALASAAEAAKRADETSKESKPDDEQRKDGDATKEETTESKDATLRQQSKEEAKKESKMEVDNEQQSSTESPKAQKKTKKTKKKQQQQQQQQQQPISEQAIPLPPPSAEGAK